MSTELYEVTGIGNWAKLFERNKDNNEDFHGEGGATTIDVLLDKEELDVVTKSGSRLKPKLTEDGIVIKFKRKFNHPSVPALGGLPKVADEEGTAWDDEVSIGNGSKVKVFFSVYDTKMGKGTRLEGVQVLDLVEYEDDSESTGIKLPF